MPHPQKVTVGQIKHFLASVNPKSHITFGSSKYSQRPLIFYRFKRRGDNLLQIELNELDNTDDAVSEFECRETVEYFLKQLNDCLDNWEFTFGATIDASPLEFDSIENVVAINLAQTEEPEWQTSKI